jgi:16S rRNA (cytosine1402-N4)-methyltransferase
MGAVSLLLGYLSMLHQPVLLAPTLHYWTSCGTTSTYIDATFGRGGHTQALLAQHPYATVFALDRDPDAITYAHTLNLPGLHPFQQPFGSLPWPLPWGGSTTDGVLIDLGLCSTHIDTPERGFSYQQNGPLDMRMDNTQGLTACRLLQTTPLKNLTQIIKTYGDVKQAHTIATQLIKHRRILSTTFALKKCLTDMGIHTPKEHAKIFQALRMAVNQEIAQLSSLCTTVHTWTHGYLCILAFHSLEVRCIRAYLPMQYWKKIIIIVPSELEIANNCRARSARLLVYQRCDTGG